MDVQLLKYFITVARTLNFTEAAEELFLSQATLSRRINTLEEELGVKLFDRTTRSVQLSEAGRVCLADAKKIADCYDDLMLKASGLAGHSAGRLRIGYFRTDTAEYLARIVLRMRQEYPAIQIEYTKDELENLIRDLDDGSLDAVVLFHPCIEDSESYQRIVLAHEHPSLVVHYAHPLAERREVRFSDLLEETVVINYGLNIPARIHDTILHFFRTHGIEPENASSAINSDKLLLRVRLHECVMVDPFATASSGLPDALRRVSIPSDEVIFNRDFIIKEGNINPLVPFLKRTVQKMVLEGAFDDAGAKNDKN